jgi:hypothetical protein
MQQEEEKQTEKILRGLTARLWKFPLKEYLSSEHFLRFCRKYDLEDRWKDHLELSYDTPGLYGSDVLKNAFVLFLHTIFHAQKKEFPALFAHLMMDFCRWNASDLPLDDLKADLVHLGYLDQEISNEFSFRPVKGENIQKSPDEPCSQ